MHFAELYFLKQIFYVIKLDSVEFHILKNKFIYLSWDYKAVRTVIILDGLLLNPICLYRNAPTKVHNHHAFQFILLLH